MKTTNNQISLSEGNSMFSVLLITSHKTKSKSSSSFNKQYKKKEIKHLYFVFLNSAIAEYTVETSINEVKSTKPTISSAILPSFVRKHMTCKRGGITREIAVNTKPPTKETISPKLGKNQAMIEIIRV